MENNKTFRASIVKAENYQSLAGPESKNVDYNPLKHFEALNTDRHKNIFFNSYQKIIEFQNVLCKQFALKNHLLPVYQARSSFFNKFPSSFQNPYHNNPADFKHLLSYYYHQKHPFYPFNKSHHFPPQLASAPINCVSEDPKPTHSYIGIIAMAILNSKEKKLVLSDIYQWILDNYPYFRKRGPGWRNSIRHNLSLNDCFIKSGRSANGKGHYWAVHPANVNDFEKGDFRRRRAQRKVRRAMGLSVPEEDDDSPPVSPGIKKCEVESEVGENIDFQADKVEWKSSETDYINSVEKVENDYEFIKTNTNENSIVSKKNNYTVKKMLVKRPKKRGFDMESLLKQDDGEAQSCGSSFKNISNALEHFEKEGMTCVKMKRDSKATHKKQTSESNSISELNLHNINFYKKHEAYNNFCEEKSSFINKNNNDNNNNMDKNNNNHHKNIINNNSYNNNKNNLTDEHFPPNSSKSSFEFFMESLENHWKSYSETSKKSEEKTNNYCLKLKSSLPSGDTLLR